MIDVRDLCFHYQGSKHQVFSHFALQLNPGRVYGLLGKNGTGKSTLLYLISGLLRPDSGTVTVNGMESRLRLPEMLSILISAMTCWPNASPTSRCRHVPTSRSCPWDKRKRCI